MIGVEVSNPHFKVTVTNTGGFNPAYEKPSSTNVILTEQDKYLDVKAIKPSPFDDFCIVTLVKPVVYSYRVAPLCLPVMENKEYDKEGTPGQEGTVLGFGYDDVVAVYAKRQFDESKMTERKIEKSTFQIISAKNCRELTNSGTHVVICRQILLRGCVGLMWKYINYKIFDRRYNIFVNSARTKRTFTPI